MPQHLFLFFLVYFILVFVWPSWRVWRKTGVNPVVIPKDDSAHGFIGNIFRFIILLTLATTAVNAFFPKWEKFLLPFWYLENDLIRWAGLLLLYGSLIWIMAAQRQMNKSWRIGIDEKGQAELVASGLFRFSRNPIFLGMLATMTGFFLVLPNALSLLVCALSWVVLQVQARLEEEFLQKTKGEAYREYRRKVRRWL